MKQIWDQKSNLNNLLLKLDSKTIFLGNWDMGAKICN